MNFSKKAFKKKYREGFRKGTVMVKYYAKYPFLKRKFHHESKVFQELPSDWYYISSFSEFMVLTKMYEEFYNTDETPLLSQAYGGKSFYGISFDSEFCALTFYILNDYVDEVLKMRAKMREVYERELPN